MKTKIREIEKMIQQREPKMKIGSIIFKLQREAKTWGEFAAISKLVRLFDEYDEEDNGSGKDFLLVSGMIVCIALLAGLAFAVYPIFQK